MHLRITQLDSLVLHEMRQPWEDLQIIWRAMEDVYAEGYVAKIGVSHAHDPVTFRQLLAFAKVKPSFVQNPAFAYNQWDRDIRMICYEYDIIYQAYSLNHQENEFVYQTREVKAIASRLQRTPQQGMHNNIIY
jgi:diketogulonate reductase-like aldo/keto reductase